MRFMEKQYCRTMDLESIDGNPKRKWHIEVMFHKIIFKLKNLEIL
jgi:hypothetical protein